MSNCLSVTKQYKGITSMKWSSLVVAPLITFVLAGQAPAEEYQTGEVLALVEQISELHAQLNGKTATFSGGLGTIFGDTIYFQSDLGSFKVQFDAGREARRLIEGCQITLFGNVESRCVFEVDAELVVSERYSPADGGTIELIVYNVRP